MNETDEAVRDILRRTRAKQARRAVSRKLALYHQSLVDALSTDTNSFFERVMEQVKRDISAHHHERAVPANKTH
jgi:regulator of sigma D